MQSRLMKGLAVLALLMVSVTASAQSLSEDTNFGSNPGNLRMFYYAPANLPAGSPLVVVAHGCLQTAQQIADTTGWVELAYRFKIAVVFPQTSLANEPSGGCFRTWDPAHQARGAGEPLSVRQMVDRMRVLYPAISASRIYITGLSSGGMLTNVMLATYPDVFAAGAPQSAYPYKCATSTYQVGACAAGGRNLTPAQWGDLARSGYPGYAGPWPRVQIWHGGADTVINLSNQYQQVEQWTDVNGIDAISDSADYLLGRPRISYKTGSGDTRVQTITVQWMGHAVAVDPGAGPQQCGLIGPYATDANICAAYWIGLFFGVVN